MSANPPCYYLSRNALPPEWLQGFINTEASIFPPRMSLWAKFSVNFCLLRMVLFMTMFSEALL